MHSFLGIYNNIQSRHCVRLSIMLSQAIESDIESGRFVQVSFHNEIQMKIEKLPKRKFVKIGRNGVDAAMALNRCQIVDQINKMTGEEWANVDDAQSIIRHS